MITVNKMKQLEEAAEKTGVTRLQMMRNAGHKAAQVIFAQKQMPAKCLILAHHGNNGGDGFALAKELAQAGWKVIVGFVGSKEQMSSESTECYSDIANDSRIVVTTELSVIDALAEQLKHQDVIVDALLGTGSKGELSPVIAHAVDIFNSCRALRISLDVATGFHLPSGALPDTVVAFHDVKEGTKVNQHRTIVVDIGIPKDLAKTIGN